MSIQLQGYGSRDTEGGQDAPRGLSSEQLALRANKLGASEVAAVLQLDPYRSASDVWLEKTGRCTPFAGNEATKRGQYQEPGLVLVTQDETGIEFSTTTTFTHPSNLLCATPDRLNKDMTQGIEAKSTALVDGWGEPGTDQVPDKVLVQVAQQFLCVATLQVIWIPVELIGFKAVEWQLFRVEREGPGLGELIQTVEARGLDFMRRYVLTDRPPTDFRPSLEVLKRVRRVPNKIVPVARELVERLEKVKAAKKILDKEEEKAKAYLLASMGDAEGGVYDGGEVTYLEHHRREFVTKASTYRSLLIKPAKVKKLAPAAVEENPKMLGDDEISGAIDQASGQVYSDADSGL